MPSRLRSVLALTLLSVPGPLLAIPISQPLVPVTESFDTLAASGAGSALPSGWTISESGSAANGAYAAGTGTGTVGDTYSLGASGSTERSLGSLRSSSLATVLGVSFQNATGLTITELTLSYVGEQWRLGALGRTDRLDFAYSLDGTTWLDADALDFTAPVTSGAGGALDGNAAGNRLALSHTLSGLSIPSGGGLWLRWTDYDAAGADDVLGIDDFSLVARAGATTAEVPDELPGWGALALCSTLLLTWRRLRRPRGPRVLTAG